MLKGHNGSITSLSLHQTRNNILISGSADKLVKVWDLCSLKEVDSIADLNKEIQNLKWSLNNESVFACHSGENDLRLYDLRTSAQSIAQIDFKGPEIDTFVFNTAKENEILVATVTGDIFCVDSRMTQSKPLYSFKAHNKNIPGMSSTGKYLVTNSLDSKLRIWDLEFEGGPKLIKEKITPLKQLFTSSIHPENPYLFACGASGSEVIVWDFYAEVVEGKESGEPQVPEVVKGEAGKLGDGVEEEDEEDDDDGLELEE